MVGEPSVEETIAILRGLKERYEVHHGVRITDAALVAAATLSHRYISDRFLPDKAIDLIDEAASQAAHRDRLHAHRDRPARAPAHPARDREAGPGQGEGPRLQGAPGGHRGGPRRAGRADRRHEGALAAGEGAHRPPTRGQAADRGHPGRRRAGTAGRRPGTGRPAPLRPAGGAGAPARRGHPEPQATPAGARHDPVGGGGRGGRGPRRLPLDRHPGHPPAGGREGKAARDGGPDLRTGGGPGRRHPGGGGRRPARPRRAQGPEPAHRLVPLPGPHRASARPSSPGPWPSSCSTTSGPWSGSTCPSTWRSTPWRG